MDSFLQWVGDLETGSGIFSWGRTDYEVIKENCNLRGYVSEKLDTLLASWHDAQAEYSRKTGFDRFGKCISLSHAMGSLGLTPSKYRHSALADALDTYMVMKNLEDPLNKNILEGIRDLLTVREGTLCYSIGSLFSDIHIS